MPSDNNKQGLGLPDAGLRRLVFRSYDRAVELVILGVIPLMLVALAFAFVEAVLTTGHMIPLIHDSLPGNGGAPADETGFRGLVNRVLDVVILIELFNTFMEYARTRHIRLSNLLDVTIVFALREVLIKLYSQTIAPAELLTLCAVIIVLVIARRLTNHGPPQPRG